jgi:hypothetical protein
MILITGADRIGKTTFAKYLGEFLNLPVYGFADEVRKSFEAQIYFQSYHHLKIDYLKHTDEWLRLFKEHNSDIWNWLNKNDDVKNRLRVDIISYAENIKEKHGKDYWANKLYEEHTDAPKSIIHDFRFNEELFFILAQSNKRVDGHKLFHPLFNCHIPVVIQLMTMEKREKVPTLSPVVTDILDNCGLTFFIPDANKYEDKEEWKSIVKNSASEISKYLQTFL